AGNGRVQVGDHAVRIARLAHIHPDLPRVAVANKCDITPADYRRGVSVRIVGDEIREVASAIRNESAQVSYDPIWIGRDSNVNTKLSARSGADESEACVAETKIGHGELGEVANATRDRGVQVGHHLIRIARH